MPDIIFDFKFKAKVSITTGTEEFCATSCIQISTITNSIVVLTITSSK